MNQDIVFSFLKQSYEEQIQCLEDKHQAEIESKDREINSLNREINSLNDRISFLEKLIDTLSKSRNTIIITNHNDHQIEATSESNAMSESYTSENDLRQAQIGNIIDQAQGGSNIEGIGVQNNYAPEQNQNLAEAAEEIHNLLNQLQLSCYTEVAADIQEEIPAETQEEINVAVRGISKNPALSQRVVSALRGGGIEALRELADNAYVNILLAAWEAWRNPE